MPFTYDLTLKPASRQYKDELVQTVYDPVVVNGVLTGVLPDGTFWCRVLATEPAVREVQQVQSGTPPVVAQTAGTFPLLSQKANLFHRARADKVTSLAGQTFTVTVWHDSSRGGTSEWTAEAVSFDGTTMTVYPLSQSDTERHVVLANSGVREVRIVPN